MGTSNYNMPHRITLSWYTGRWWVGCYIWYSEEWTGRGSCNQWCCHSLQLTVRITWWFANSYHLSAATVGLKGTKLANLLRHCSVLWNRTIIWISRSRKSSTSNISKDTVIGPTFLQWQTRKPYVIYRMVPFLITLHDQISRAHHYSILNIWETVFTTNRKWHVWLYWTVPSRMTLIDLQFKKVSSAIPVWKYR